MIVKYDEETNKIILIFDDVSISLPANHNTLGLWKFLNIPKYQKWLWEQQSKKCADCGKDLPKPRGNKIAYLHHDPPLGTPDSKAVDYNKKTRNRVLCYECHKKTH